MRRENDDNHGRPMMGWTAAKREAQRRYRARRRGENVPLLREPNPVVGGLKRCSVCRQVRPTEDFWRDKTSGYKSACRECSLPKHYHRRKTAGRTAHRRWKRLWQARNPDKARAHKAVFEAIKAGLLVRGLCERCGGEGTHAHHEDYTQPLQVRWLCLPHHREVHT